MLNTVKQEELLGKRKFLVDDQESKRARAASFVSEYNLGEAINNRASPVGWMQVYKKLIVFVFAGALI